MTVSRHQGDLMFWQDWRLVRLVLSTPEGTPNSYEGPMLVVSRSSFNGFSNVSYHWSSTDSDTVVSAEEWVRPL